MYFVTSSWKSIFPHDSISKCHQKTMSSSCRDTCFRTIKSQSVFFLLKGRACCGVCIRARARVNRSGQSPLCWSPSASFHKYMTHIHDLFMISPRKDYKIKNICKRSAVKLDTRIQVNRVWSTFEFGSSYATSSGYNVSLYSHIK